MRGEQAVTVQGAHPPQKHVPHEEDKSQSLSAKFCLASKSECFLEVLQTENRAGKK